MKVWSKMSAEALIAPYINRIVTLINERSTAKLDICCEAGEVNVNIPHDLVEVPHIEQTMMIYWRKISMVHSSIGSTKTLARAEEAKVAMTEMLPEMHKVI